MSELTGFQEQAPYDERTDLRTDFVMVYGLNDTTAERIERWRKAGYRIHLMTGISWGTYQDYLYGDWDGERHWDDAQTVADGSPVLHGKDIPYMVPTIRFTDYLTEKLRPILDLGVEVVHLEEPEFWARAGYSPAFRREWQAYFGEPWQDPHSSPEAHFRAGQLKQHLLTRSLDRVTTVLRDEALRAGRDIRFSVPTHSLLNYTQWQIVSPESKLRELPSIHGAIAQVWTGTSRTPNVYAGRRAERTFETAYLEYGIAQDLSRGTDRTLWFLHDPIEDQPDRTWEDYLANYRRTVVASLLHTDVSTFEVAPWPHRIFTRPYRSEHADERIPIPASTATSYLITMNSLRDLDGRSVHREIDGPRFGVLLSDTAMFQRWRPGVTSGHYDGLQDALAVEGRELLNFSDFYGLALPPLFCGQQVRPVQLENLITTPGALDDLDVLILSYEFQKPLTPALHYALAAWVGQGGSLLYVGDGSDPYHRIRQWWSGRYPTPAQHLAEALGVPWESDAIQTVGAGRVRFLDAAPAEFTGSAARAAELCDHLRDLTVSGGHRWQPRPWLSVRRGPYLIGATLSEGQSGVTVTGRYLDLLDPRLPVINSRDLGPGEVIWFRDLDQDDELVLASAGRIRDLDRTDGRVGFRCEAPDGVEVITALRSPEPPRQVDGAEWAHDGGDGILRLRHPGVPAGTTVTVSW
jgi:hypothetical protein